MILKGNQRGNGRKLAKHLTNLTDNEHIRFVGPGDFTARDIMIFMLQTEASSKFTNCKKPFYSLSLNPPEDADVTDADFIAAADRAAHDVGLTDQPRTPIIIHEKNGRLHAHCVWSRIDTEKARAINIYKDWPRLNALSRDLFLEHGWDMPPGLKDTAEADPLNFDLPVWQQAKRISEDPRDLKRIISEAMERSDNLASLRAALEEQALYIAKGDKRGFVLIHHSGEVLSLARYSGLKAKELKARFGDPAQLSSVEQVEAEIDNRKLETVKAMREQLTYRHQKAMQPLYDQRRRM